MSMCDPLTPQPYRFDQWGEFFPKGHPELPVQTINYCLTSLQGAGTLIDVEETKGPYHLSPIAIPRLQV